MDDEVKAIDVAYLLGVFEPAKLQYLASRMIDVLRRANLDTTSAEPLLLARNNSHGDIIGACNTLLDPLGLELRELQPRRLGLRGREFSFNDDDEREEFNDTASLDAALLASWLLRFGHVSSLEIQSPNNIPAAFADVLRVTLPFSSAQLQDVKLRGPCFYEADVENILSGVASLGALQCLHMMLVPVTNKIMASLSHVLRASSHTITDISFGLDDFCTVDAKEFTACLKQCSNLKDLDLWMFPFDSGEVLKLFQEYIIATNTLERLSVDYIREEILVHILQAVSLNRTIRSAKFNVFYDKGCDAAKEVVNVLENNTSLRKLILSGLKPESPEYIARVFDTLRTNQTLESFRFGIVDPVCDVKGEPALSTLLEVIGVNRTLKSLHLDAQMISNKTLMRIAKAMTENTTLKVLRIHSSNLGDEVNPEGFCEDIRDSCDRMEAEWNIAGLKQLAVSLPESKVKKLYLNWAFEMCDPPLAEVMQALQANRTITRLHLHNIRYYGSSHITALAEYVRRTKVLKHISMVYEIERPEYGIALLDALAENTSVNHVEFFSLAMNLEVCKHFGDMLAKNRTLHWLGQHQMYCSPEELVLLSEGMEQNYTMLELDLKINNPCLALSRIRRALAVNEFRLNRAVDFVLDTFSQAEIDRCSDAFRLLCEKDSLRLQLLKVTGTSAEIVDSLIGHSKQKLLQLANS